MKSWKIVEERVGMWRIGNGSGQRQEDRHMDRSSECIDRLRTMIEHLRFGQWEAEFRADCWGGPEKNKDGKLVKMPGCALGECPKLWPNDWEWKGGRLREWEKYTVPRLIPMTNRTSGRTLFSAMEWFCMTEDEVRDIFYSNTLINKIITRESIANKLESILMRKENEKDMDMRFYAIEITKSASGSGKYRVGGQLGGGHVSRCNLMQEIADGGRVIIEELLPDRAPEMVGAENILGLIHNQPIEVYAFRRRANKNGEDVGYFGIEYLPAREEEKE